MIRFVVFHADNRRYDPKSGDPRSLIRLLFDSARRWHPGAETIILTDLYTDFDGLRGSATVVRFAVDPERTMVSRMRAQRQFLLDADASSHIVFLDSDILINGALGSVFSQDFDVAVTYRDTSKMVPRQKLMPINGGVLFVRMGRKDAALAFFDELLRIYETRHAEKEAWWGDQYALADLIGINNVPAHGSAVVRTKQACIVLLPDHEYNFAPRPSALLGRLPDKKILHFKGKRKKMMPLYAALASGSPKRHAAYWALASQAAQEALIPFAIRDLMPEMRWSWKKKRRKWMGPFNRLGLESMLKKLLRGKRVLILGSGASAHALGPIPPDVVICTTNAGLKLFEGGRLGRCADLVFVVQSRKDKMVSLESGETAKMQLISRLVRDQKPPRIITNRDDLPDFLEKRRAEGGRIYFDDGRDTRYLKALIRPATLESIRGASTVQATSSGLLLLQYALTFGAAEIYLAGIDFGRGGYFWGPSTYPWRHDDIDENFVRIVGGRFKNVYSASDKSPAAAYLPVRSF